MSRVSAVYETGWQPGRPDSKAHRLMRICIRAGAVTLAAALAAAGCTPQMAQRPAGPPHSPRAPASSPAGPPLALNLAGGFDVSPASTPAPPDAAVAVGPSSVLTANNGQVRLQDRAGNLI